MRTRWIIAAVLIVIGAAWIGQGLGTPPRPGFMVGDIKLGRHRGDPGRSPASSSAWTALRMRPSA